MTATTSDDQLLDQELPPEGERRTIQEIREWLDTPPVAMEKRFGHDFIPIGVVLQDLVGFLGADGFEIISTPPVMHRQFTNSEGNVATQFSTMVTLTIYPEDAPPIIRTAAGGAWGWDNPNGKFAPAIAESYGIRRCAQMLGRRFGVLLFSVGDNLDDLDIASHSRDGNQEREAGPSETKRTSTPNNSSKPTGGRRSKPRVSRDSDRDKMDPITPKEQDKLLLEAQASSRGSNKAIRDFLLSNPPKGISQKAAVTGEVWADSVPEIAEQLVYWQYLKVMDFLG